MNQAVKIIDIIHHRNKYSTQVCVVVDRDPEFLYERRGDWLIADDSGFWNFYHYERPGPHSKAFAGRKFDIPMKEGEPVKADGQWWDATPKSHAYLLDHGIGTAEGLATCNVFTYTGGHIEPDLVKAWLAENTPSNNYSRYDKRHKDYGKQFIESPWPEKAETRKEKR